MSTPSEAEQVLQQAVSRSKAAKQAGHAAARANLVAQYDDTLDAASKAALAAAFKAADMACDVAEAQVLATDLIVAFESSAKAFADTIKSGLSELHFSHMVKMKAAYAAMENAKKDEFTYFAMLMVQNNPVIYTAMVNAGMAHASGLDFATGVNARMRQELGLVTAVKADSSTKADVLSTVSQWV